ncbi:MAG: hypothetical protein AAGF94_01695 [Pseudomonadota bacterium]
MDEKELNQRLWEITGRFFKRGPTSFLTEDMAPFDTKKPNLHDSKAEFMAEKELVEKGLSHIDALFDILNLRSDQEGTPARGSVALNMALDKGARQANRDRVPEHIYQMIQKCAVDGGLTLSTLWILVALNAQFFQRNRELIDQEAIYWSSPNRAPNHYARIIALRFAKLIARETGKKPTFGTARDGGHPSTEFGRALEDVFKLLEIKATVKGPASWAIGQLTDEDLQRSVFGNALAGAYPMPPTSSLDPHEFTNALSLDRKKASEE